MQFKDVAYDACDLLDEFRYQIHSATERRRDEPQMEEPLYQPQMGQQSHEAFCRPDLDRPMSIKRERNLWETRIKKLNTCQGTDSSAAAQAKACLSSVTTDDNKDSEGFCCKWTGLQLADDLSTNKLQLCMLVVGTRDHRRIWYRNSCSKSSAS